MSAQHFHRTCRRADRFVPRLEGLEDRHLLAVVVACVGDTITFTGNWQADTVIINDNGAGLITGLRSNPAGDIVPFVPCAGIREIVVDTGANNDSVTYNLNGDLGLGATRIVRVNLGAGNDWLRVTANADVDIGAGALLRLKLDGGDGTDFMYLFYRGELDGRLELVADGGAANDRVYADLRLDCGSTGSLDARVLGGLGDDYLDLLVREQCPLDPTAIDALISGGLGFDTCTRTANILADASCNVVNVVV